VSHRKVSFDLKARQFVAAAARPVPDAHFGFKEFLGDEARRELLAAPFDPEPTVRLFRQAFAAHAFTDGLDGVLYSDFQIYLPDDILVKVDRMSMIHGLEARAPFLDHELIQLAASLPAAYKLAGTRTKHVLRLALWGHAPLRILERGKAGFNVPMAQWLLGPLRELLWDRLSPAGVRRLGLWSPEAVQRLLREHETRARDRSRTLWAMLMFVLWNERHRGGRPA
jgi:asparagine synthase (glutamine-hydrolysing)